MPETAVVDPATVPGAWVDWVRAEQSALWTDLAAAIRSAVNGVWSMRAGDVTKRIVQAARLVGPTPYEEVEWSLLAGGVYEAVLAAGGVAATLPDEAEWQRLDALMAGHGARATLRATMAGTVAAVDSERERDWINAGEE